jgi:pimeloyl-ACP methyl ester carboxylesterase
VSAPDGTRRVAVSAGELAVLDLGDADAPAVLFVHGFPTSSFLWRAFVPMFPPAMRALAPDLLGSGDSDKPAAAPLGVEAQAGYLAELLDQLGLERVAIVGHGHGGGIAQLLALEGRADVLVLMDAIAFDAWASAPMRELRSLLAGEVAVEELIGWAFDAGMARRDRLGAEAIAAYRRPFGGPEGAAALARWARSLDDAGLGGREDDLAALDVPVFILWGEDDPFTPPAAADRLNELIPRSSLALLPGCGHFVPEEAAPTVAPLLYEYLRSAYAGIPHAHVAGPTPIEFGRRPRRE